MTAAPSIPGDARARFKAWAESDMRPIQEYGFADLIQAFEESLAEAEAWAHARAAAEPATGRTLTIRFEGRPPTPNQRMHYRAADEIHAEWREAARKVALDRVNRWPAGWGAPITLCDMHLEFVVPSRGRRDWDNLVASTKPLTDGIVLAGILEDDDLKYFRRITTDWHLEKGLSATVYTITELVPPELQLGLPEPKPRSKR